MKKFNKQTGLTGERLAEEWLVNQGYEVVGRNFRTKLGEIDLVMKQNDILVFIEVKTKKGDQYGTPEETWDRRKAERVRRMATVYLGGREVKCRIDLVAVVLDAADQPVSIKHYENAG